LNSSGNLEAATSSALPPSEFQALGVVPLFESIKPPIAGIEILHFFGRIIFLDRIINIWNVFLNGFEICTWLY
jgi:hypothetical protein